MKWRMKAGMAVLIAFSLVLMNLNPVFYTGDKEITIKPIIETETEKALAATSFKIMDGASQGNITGGLVELSSTDTTLIITSEDQATIGAFNVTWASYDETVIEVVPDAGSNGQKVTVKAKNPGYTSLWAQVTYEGVRYDIMCRVYVPLEIGNKTINEKFDDINIGANLSGGGGSIKEWRGMDNRLFMTDTDKTYYLQLSTPGAKDVNSAGENVGDLYSHYLVKLMNVTYAPGVTNTTTGDALIVSPAAITWTSSDTTICTVDEYGVVSAVKAGIATVTASIHTNVGGKDEEKHQDITVLVVPTAQLANDPNPNKPDKRLSNLSIVAPNSTFTLDTNIAVASNMVWNLRKGSASGEEININKNDYMKVDISNHSGAVTIKDAKAGVYYLLARPAAKYAETMPFTYLKIKIVVPFIVNTADVYMNVGDTYDVFNNTNMPNRNAFSYRSTAPNKLSISGTVATGRAEGEANIELHYNYILDIYAGLTSDEKALVVSYGAVFDPGPISVPVHVIDGISISQTNATIYVGSTLQLDVTTSNYQTSVGWSSSDPTIATVDEFGLVKGIKTGDVIITATQTINGVTKTVACEIRVSQSSTNITLNPSTASIAVGDNLTLNATVVPTAAGVTLKWVSSDPSIVDIVDAGKLSATVQAKKGGTAIITAINAQNVVIGSCLIKVHEAVTGLTLSESNVTVNLALKWFQLYATITPVSASDQELVWKSTDESVLKVDANGKVTIVKSGVAAVIVSVKSNGAISAICNITVTKSTTGIKLDTTSKSMYSGETYRLTYTVTPADATAAGVTWISTNSTVATVDASGLVSAKSPGTTTIIVKSNDGGHMAQCQVDVSRAATAVKLDMTKLMLNVGDSYLFETTLTPADTTETALAWESSDSSIAIVSKRGKVTAKKAGTCIIMVKTKNGSAGYCNLVVYQGATGVQLDSEDETISVNETLELTATVLPNTASNTKVTWASNNPTVAYVNDKGEVKGIIGGVAVITATAEDGGYVANCIVTVEELVTKIELNETSYRLGLSKSFKLEATISGVTASNKQVKWSSSNKSIVSVDSKGVMKGLKYGKATITCSATDGSGAQAVCEVEVVRLVTEISLNETYITLVQGKSVTLKATVSPKNATYLAPVFTSDKLNVAVVNKKGVITGLTPGDAIVTVSADDSSGISTICYVHVIAPVASSGVTPQESEVVMAPGETKTVGISIKPNNSTDTYTWSTDNTAVAKVDAKTGKITAIDLGIANITIMTESGRKASIKVYVVGLSRTYIELQQYSTFKLEVDGANAASGLKPRWDVENPEIATIVGGTVTARALGTTTVYAVVNGRRLACTVKVVKIK